MSMSVHYPYMYVLLSVDLYWPCDVAILVHLSNKLQLNADTHQNDAAVICKVMFLDM